MHDYGLNNMNSIDVRTWPQGSGIGKPEFDRETALASVGGDEDLLREIGALFLNESTADLTDLERCVFERNAYLIERTAHRLKGSIGAFGRGPVYQAALRLQEEGRTGNLRYVEADFAEFNGLFVQLCDEIRAFITAQ